MDKMITLDNKIIEQIRVYSPFIDMQGLGYYDNNARFLDILTGSFISVDPLAGKYPSLTPYNHCANNPLILIDPDGRAWLPKFDENKIVMSYEWVEDDKSYDNKGNLLPGLYAQAIYFTDNGTFDASSKYNIGSSTAIVYKADGTIEEFDACTNPSNSKKICYNPRRFV